MKCIIYTRVSTDMQDTANQLSQLKEYAHKQNWQILDVKTDICSGSKSAEERTGLKEAFDLARRRKFDVLLFWSLDRFSREGSRKTLEYPARPLRNQMAFLYGRVHFLTGNLCRCHYLPHGLSCQAGENSHFGAYQSRTRPCEIQGNTTGTPENRYSHYPDGQRAQNTGIFLCRHWP